MHDRDFHLYTYTWDIVIEMYSSAIFFLPLSSLFLCHFRNSPKCHGEHTGQKVLPSEIIGDKAEARTTETDPR